MIAEALLLATWMSTSAKVFPIQYTPRKTVGGHADNVINPTKLSLHKQKFQRFTTRFASDFRVGDFMPPAEAENALLARYGRTPEI